MPSINMIAPRRAEKKRLEANIRKILMVMLAEVIVVVGVSGLMVQKIISTNNQITKVDSRLESLKPTVKKIDLYTKETNTLKPKVDTLTTAKNTTLRWCRIMDSLSTSLPDKTWLTRVATLPMSDPKAEVLAINISGVSASQELIGDTMLRVHDQVKDFSKLDLNYTQKTMIGKTPAFEFDLAAGISLKDEKSKKEVGKS